MSGSASVRITGLDEDMAALDAEEIGGCHCGGCEGHHHG